MMDMNEDEIELESEGRDHHVRYPLNKLHKTLHSKFNH